MAGITQRVALEPSRADSVKLPESTPLLSPGDSSSRLPRDSVRSAWLGTERRRRRESSGSVLFGLEVDVDATPRLHV